MKTSKNAMIRARSEANFASPYPSRKLIILVVAATLAGSNSYSAVFNGDFETGAAAFVEWPGYLGGGNPPEIPGWAGTGQRGINPVFPGGPNDAPFRDNGNNFTTVAFLQGPGTLQQTIIGFSPGSPYVLKFDFNASNAASDLPTFSIFLDETVLASSTDYFPAPGEVRPVGRENPWYHLEIDFEAKNSISTLRFASMPATGNDAVLLLDNVSIALVPEPVSVLPVLLSLLVLAIWRTLPQSPRLTSSSHHPVPAGRVPRRGPPASTKNFASSATTIR